jgi:FKBP-type peptidyl-prolyl cis-trans isomerase
MRKCSGLKIEDLRIGEGPEASKGKQVYIRYEGLLTKGEKFQTNFGSSFTIGKREVIPGLEYGVEGMRVGGIRKLSVSPHLAFGTEGVPGAIPPNARLYFIVELLDVKNA